MSIHEMLLGTMLSLAASASFAQEALRLQPDPPRDCPMCDAWNQEQQPFRVFGNTYYVGVAGLSSVLITSDKGHILLDGGLPQSAPLIAKSIQSLGFRIQDIRLIVNSHAHHDHAGGIAALHRASGAIVAASSSGAWALEHGETTIDDPQHGFGRDLNGFPEVQVVRVVSDGEVLRVGDLSITAHMVPGHTPGSTTWTWRSCEQTQCLDIVYADSLNSVSAPYFKYTRSPGVVDRFRRSIATVQNLNCDILFTVHPEFFNLKGKLQRRAAQPNENPFINSQACRAYADEAARSLDDRIAKEQ